MQLTCHIYAGVYCIIDREDLSAVMLGSAAAEALLFIPLQTATGTLWAYNFTYEVALPALRACATMLILYRLWCEYRVRSVSITAGDLGMWRFCGILWPNEQSVC